MEVSKEIKDRIIDLFLNSTKRINNILKEVAPNGEITIEEFYKILEEYKAKNPDTFKRKSPNKPSQFISYEEVFELREKELPYKQIAEYFTEKGIPVSSTTISDMCKIIYKKKGKEEPEKRKLKLFDDKIFELREKRYSYKQIAEYIGVSDKAIGERCKEIYKEKGKKEPDLLRIEISDDEIFELREQKLTYEQIYEYFKEKNVKVCEATIAKNCKRIYKERGLEEPHSKKNQISDDEILNLREHRLTYKQIAEYFNKQDISISEKTIADTYQRICRERHLENIDMRKGKNREAAAYPEKLNISNEEIFELRTNGEMSYQQIQEYYQAKDIKVSITTIAKRCSKIFKQKGIEKPDLRKNNKIKKTNIDKTADEDKLKSAIVNLKNSRNATDEQIKKMADLYGVDLELEDEKEL